MGCDIHLYIEYREKERANHPNPSCRQWRSLGGQFMLWRAYELFAAIAGVRAARDFQIKHQPRGLPDDLGYHSDSDAAAGTHGSHHSHSWLTFDEFRDAIHPIVFEKYRLSDYRAVLAAM